MAKILPIKGAGAFQWNTAGWFGTQIGCTLWILMVGVLISDYNMSIGLLIICFFIAPNIIGYVIWHRREHIVPYPAIQYLMVTISLFAFFTLLTLDLSGLANRLDEQLGNSFPYLYLVLLSFPVLMIQLHFQNLDTKRKQR